MPNLSWIAIGISVVTLIAGTITAATTAALQRKQMRQIELHRADPSVPLLPPPHPLTLFCKKWSALIVGVCINLAFLISAFTRVGPITRLEVLSIAVFTSALGLQVGAVYIFSVHIRLIRYIANGLIRNEHKMQILQGKMDCFFSSEGKSKDEGSDE